MMNFVSYEAVEPFYDEYKDTYQVSDFFKDLLYEPTTNTEPIEVVMPIRFKEPKKENKEQEIEGGIDTKVEPLRSNQPEGTLPYPPNVSSFSNEYKMHLLCLDIEDLLRSQGITHVGKRAIKFGKKGLRAKNASFGVKNSWHKVLDPYTGNAMARDISIPGGSWLDYDQFRHMLLSNQKVRDWMAVKGWGIINEITTAAKSKTNATGNHFHFGPDRWAVRTWKKWLNDPKIDVRTIV